MRRFSNFLISLAALGICAAMTFLTLDSSISSVIFNLAVLGIMLLIIVLAWAAGFLPMGRARRALDRASVRLVAAYRDPTGMKAEELTRTGVSIFGIEYLDGKYQEYLGFLQKTNSPCDISDYVGEYEINHYTHRRLIELVPDILTSLGILGTFIGLVIGLRGFNPSSYEAMASSITTLMDGIKVAFVTSIDGIALSVAYSYCLRGAVSELAESLDNFTDKYYLCAVSPHDDGSMARILDNQLQQLQTMEQLEERMASAVANSLSPVLKQMNQTLQHFSDTVTMQQEELMENIAASVMAAMKKEFIAEFLEMRGLLKETNQVQKNYLDYIQKAQGEFQNNLLGGMQQMNKAQEQFEGNLLGGMQQMNKAQEQFAGNLQEGMQQMTKAQQMFETNLVGGMHEVDRAFVTSAQRADDAVDHLNTQQKNLRDFTAYMSACMESMRGVYEKSERMNEAMLRHIETVEKLTRNSREAEDAAERARREAENAADRAQLPVPKRIDDIEELTDRMDKIILMMELEQKAAAKKKKGLSGLFQR